MRDTKLIQWKETNEIILSCWIPFAFRPKPPRKQDESKQQISLDRWL